MKKKTIPGSKRVAEVQVAKAPALPAVRPGKNPAPTPAPSTKGIKTLSKDHRKMARWLYAHPKATKKQMAKKFGFSYSYLVNQVTPTALWKNYMADLEEFDAHETLILKNNLVTMGHKAVAVLEDDLDHDITGFKDRIVRQNAAKDILNRIDVTGDKGKDSPEVAKVVNLTQVNIKSLTIAEKHDLAARLMQQPVDI